MKTKIITSLLLAALMICASTLIAQDEDGKSEYKTLFNNSNGQTEHGGYAAITFGYTDIDSRPALNIGGRLAWVINHQFAIGFAGKGFFNNLDKPAIYSESDYYLAGGYGGLFFQPILFAKSPVHVSFPILLGAGGIALNPRDKYKYHWDYDYAYDYAYDTDVFLVFEPGVDIEFNFLRYMRMSLGVSYRFTNNVNLIYEYQKENWTESISVDPGVLNSFSFNMAIMFGWF